MADQDDDDDSKFDEKINIMILGEIRAGKAALIKRYTSNVFGGEYLTTVGIDFQEKKLDIDGKKILVQIWDTAGEERFRNIKWKLLP